MRSCRAVDHDVGRLEIAVQHAARRAPRRDPRRAAARSRWPCPAGAARCGGAARRDPRRRCTPSTGTCGRRPRRCRRRGRRSGARPARASGPRCGSARAPSRRAPGLWGRNFSATAGRAQVVGAVDLAHAAAAEQRRRCGSDRSRVRQARIVAMLPNVLPGVPPASTQKCKLRSPGSRFAPRQEMQPASPRPEGCLRGSTKILMVLACHLERDQQVCGKAPFQRFLAL